MASFRVQGGSFPQGLGSYIGSTISLPTRSFRSEKIADAMLAEVDIATEELFRKWGSAIGAGLGGALLLGPLGLLAGFLPGKRKEIMFAARLTDGRSFVATTNDAATFARLKGTAMANAAVTPQPAPAAAVMASPLPNLKAQRDVARTTMDMWAETVLLKLEDAGFEIKRVARASEHWKAITAAQGKFTASIIFYERGITLDRLDEVLKEAEPLTSAYRRYLFAMIVETNDVEELIKRNISVGDVSQVEDMTDRLISFAKHVKR